jgi:drug/metabolite transporter (DMT)-like permease
MKQILTSMTSVYSGLPIFVATILFVCGQVLLKKSFDGDSDFVTSAVFFNIAVGLAAVLVFLQKQMKGEITYNTKKIQYAALGGILFFIGNLLWIYTISTKKPLSMIRVLMAGFETFLLVLVGYFIFSHKLTLREFVGIALVLSGIYVVGNGK